MCNVQPLQGLRYQCLQCLSYNQCQNCFWLGLISKGHKVNHQMQEYCNRVGHLSFWGWPPPTKTAKGLWC